jgi:hypothetical protein
VSPTSAPYISPSVAALLPELALPAGLVAVIFALLVYRFLEITAGNEEGLPFGLLLLLPFVCITAGVIWWIMRLLGFWEIR